MKKSIVVVSLFLALIVAIVGCEKAIRELEVSGSPKVEAFFSLTSVGDIRTVYSTLDKFERAEVWKIHFSNIIESGKYNDAQNELIEKVRDYITPEVFRENTVNKVSPFEITWYKEASMVFSPSQIKSVVADLKFSFTHGKLKTQSKTSGEEGGTEKCQCSTASDWCGSSVYCNKCVTCTQVAGCGFLLQYQCNGNCLSTTIPPQNPDCVKP
jgi:hypothetical protein